MATTTDTDRLLSDCGEDSHQSGNDDVDGCTQMHLVNEQVSPDGHYYTACVQIVVDLFAVQRLSKLDQYNVLSQCVYNLFASCIFCRLYDSLHSLSVNLMVFSMGF